jgi:hypothetical protein
MIKRIDNNMYKACINDKIMSLYLYGHIISQYK